MKKVRVFLSAIAILLAVGTALISMASTRLQTGYQFIPVGEDPARCEAKLDICDVTGNWDCRVNTSSPILKDQDAPATSCGANLKRHSAPPAP